MEFTSALAHYLVPRYSNNHKAKILHTSSLLVIATLLVVYQFVLQALTLTPNLRILGYAANINVSEITGLTNQKRAEAGVGGLEFSDALAQAAKAKGEHMLANDYWAHVAPDGTEPWTFFINSGYKYRYAGENLARDFSNAQSAMDAWMASPSHKENLLSPKYQEIGIAVVEGDLAGEDTTIIVQLFGTQLGDSTNQIPVAQAENQAPTSIPTTTSTAPTTVPSTPTINPTAIPTITQIAQITTFPTPEALLTKAQGTEASASQVLFSPFNTTRGVSMVTIIALLSIMIIDAVVIGRRKIKRMGGRVFAHIAFLGMILVIVLIARAGEIL